MMMMLLIERSKCWRCCCWSKGQSAEDVADQKLKVLKMLLIKRSQCLICCWSKGQSDKYVSDRKVKVLKMLLIERSKCWRCCCWSKCQSPEDVDADQRVAVIEYWRQRLYDVENIPMIYRCVTLMILMMSSPTIVVVDVVVEYPSR